MTAVIGLLTSLLGAYLYDMDFSDAYTLLTIALELQKNLLEYTNDKTAKR